MAEGKIYNPVTGRWYRVADAVGVRRARGLWSHRSEVSPPPFARQESCTVIIIRSRGRVIILRKRSKIRMYKRLRRILEKMKKEKS